jgi:putative tryptophan/tyrosine transport system substrate-binding protein
VSQFSIFDTSTRLSTGFGFWIATFQRKEIISVALSGLLLALSVPVVAQQQPKIARIGELLSGTRPALGSGRESLRRELRKLGYVESKNIVFESLSSEGKPDRYAALAGELVRSKVDVILTSSPDETLAAKNATKTIPIVFYAAGDPVASGLVDSLAHPGGNVTGFTTIASVLSGKRLELVKEIVPKLSRVAVLWYRSMQPWKESQLAARELGLQLHSMQVSSADELESAFTDAVTARSAAVVVVESPLASSTGKQIAALAAKNRLPTVYARKDFVEGGGLMSYGADPSEAHRRIALLVDKILKGANPAELPVEQPTKFELVINLKTAKQIGLTIPPNVLARADKVIR